MPLNARKIAHLKANIPKLFAGRSQWVTLTLRTGTGGTTTMSVRSIWRVVGDFDPTMEGAGVALTHLGAEDDVIAYFNQADITLHQLRSCLWAVLGTDAQGAQPATKYTLTGVNPIGVVPGGDRFLTTWTRQH